MPRVIAQWNIRGARANRAWLSHRRFSNAAVIALQETFLSASSAYSVPGKVIFRQDRQGRHGGGLLFAVDPSLPSRRLANPLSGPGPEIMGISVSLSPSFALQVWNVYCPPGALDGDFLQALTDTCQAPFIIVGDFNAPHSLWGAPRDSPSGTIVADWIIENNICSINNTSPTHISAGGSSSLLDLTLTSPDILHLCNAEILPDPLDSDHLPIFTTIDSSHLNPSPQTRIRLNWAAVSSKITSQWSNNENTSYEAFHNTCTSALQTGRRVSTVYIREGAPWWNSRCSYLLGQKRKHLRKARRLLSPWHWQNYKAYAAQLKREMKSAQRSHWDLVCRQANSSKSIFKVLKGIKRTYQPTPYAHRCLSIPGNPRPSPKDAADALARHFSRVGRCPRLPLDFGTNTGSTLSRPFTLAEFRAVLTSLSHGAPGPDRIPSRLLQNLDDAGQRKLVVVINRIWAEGEIPPTWLTSIIVPIPKAGKRSDNIDSYRPISLTSVLAKALERMILKRLSVWALDTSTFSNQFHGFLPFRDCSTALVRIYSDIRKARREKHFHILVALDITGAYDSVLHDELAKKMLATGIDGKVVWWVYNFISNRKFQVRWNNSLSDPYPLLFGVPQGCVLSPFLFNIYMRDVSEAVCPEVECVIYADDIFLYKQGPSLDNVIHSLQNAITKITHWGAFHNLHFNPEKSHAINFSNKRSAAITPLLINGHPIPWTNSLRILGLTFSSNLTWKKHFTDVRRRAFNNLNVFNHIASPSGGLPSRILLNIARATVINTTQFGSPIHNIGCISNSKIIEPILHAALRSALGLPRWTPTQILRREAHALPLNSSHKFSQNKFLIRHIAFGNASPLADLLSPNSSDSIFGSLAEGLLQELNIVESDVIKWKFPAKRHSTNILYHTSSFPFQNKNLNQPALNHFFEATYTDWSSWTKIATDASKSKKITSIAYWNITEKAGKAISVSHINSIFTAEALAIWWGLSKTPRAEKTVIFSDSLSVIKALENINHKSPIVILFLHNFFHQRIDSNSFLQIVWVPGHKGILGNEMADRLAGEHSDISERVPLIAPEDIVRHLRHLAWEDDSLAWISGNYVFGFPHLTRRSWEHRKLTLPRKGEVLLCRLRTRTLPTRALLFRFGLSSSPLCPVCNVPETSDHFLLECRAFRSQRLRLLRRLGLSPQDATFSGLCDLNISGCRQARLLVGFLLGCRRF